MGNNILFENEYVRNEEAVRDAYRYVFFRGSKAILISLLLLCCAVLSVFYCCLNSNIFT